MSDRQTGTQILLVATLFVILVIPFFIQNMVEQAELRTREKLLELERIEIGIESRDAVRLTAEEAEEAIEDHD